MPWVARRTWSKVKSRAINPRHPDVPNLIMIWKASECARSTLPVESAFFESVDVADEQNPEEGKHRTKNEVGVLDEHFLVNDGPGIKENDLDIEENEEHRDEIEFD